MELFIWFDSVVFNLQITKANPDLSMSKIYGAIHLLRLFGKQYVCIKQITINKLGKYTYNKKQRLHYKF